MKNTLLARMLADSGAVPALKVECVALQAGSLTSESDFSVYFPVDALITLGPAHVTPSTPSVRRATALVGQHGCVGPLHKGAALMQAHVVVAGQAYRVDWAPVRDDPARYASWLWHQTAAMQRRVSQMAQWSFCVQHHTPTQSLSSWLLQCLAQHPHAGLTLSLNALPQSIRQWADTFQTGSRQAPEASVFDVRDGRLHVPSAAALAALACTCHAQMPSHVAPA
ncbi:hypothetical protein [Limnohabitans sp. Rim47]|uniref:hypothetical protein n=1 Tax=Limnohabitans sp. Rim47 TaxID=1100721 RepID=UPI0002D50676|nr:hypothetical protein [Limnohabitans sp. Rim47]